MNTLLVPLDGSDFSRQVLPYIRTLGKTLSARVHLLRAIANAPHHHIREQAEAYLQDEAAPLRQEGIEVSIEVAFQTPAAAIVGKAREQQATLIVMATHGYSGLRRWALGSVTDEVVHTTTIPTFIIRSQELSESQPTLPPLQRILVPLDGSELSKKALPIATLLASHTRGSIHLLRSVIPVVDFYEGLQPVPIPAEVYQENMHEEEKLASDSLQEVAGWLHPENYTVDTVVVEGRPADAIIEQASQLQSDVIVMATHGYGGLERWLIGSVADKVLHATTKPLILVHAREHE